MIETISTPTSRKVRMPTMSTTKFSAPNLRKWKMPCCARIAPIRKLISTMIGTARKATMSSWWTIEVKRNFQGFSATRANAVATTPRKLIMSTKSSRVETTLLPMCRSDTTIGFSCRGRQAPFLLEAATSSNRTLKRVSRPTIAALTPEAVAERRRRSTSQAPNVSIWSTCARSMSTWSTFDLSGTAAFTSGSISRACVAVQLPAAANTSLRPSIVLFSHASLAKALSPHHATPGLKPARRTFIRARAFTVEANFSSGCRYLRGPVPFWHSAFARDEAGYTSLAGPKTAVFAPVSFAHIWSPQLKCHHSCGLLAKPSPVISQ